MRLSTVPERLQALRCLQWQEIWRLSAVSREWRETGLQWHSEAHEPLHSIKFQVSGHSCSFSCELMCDSAASGEHHDVMFFFRGLSAREDPSFRWVWQVGTENFDENDDGYWWSDAEYPNAVGVYLAGYTNWMDSFKKLRLPSDFSASGWHKIQLNFHIFEDGDFDEGYSDSEIDVMIHDVSLDTGPGLGMDGRGKGSIKIGRVVKGRSRQLEVLISAQGPVRIRKEEASGRFLAGSAVCAFDFCDDLDGFLG